MLKTIIRLRRDNDYNYAKIKDTFIPASGEVCLVDTAKQGLCAVVGDDGLAGICHRLKKTIVIRRPYLFSLTRTVDISLSEG